MVRVKNYASRIKHYIFIFSCTETIRLIIMNVNIASVIATREESYVNRSVVIYISEH